MICVIVFCIMLFSDINAYACFMSLVVIWRLLCCGFSYTLILISSESCQRNMAEAGTGTSTWFRSSLWQTVGWHCFDRQQWLLFCYEYMAYFGYNGFLCTLAITHTPTVLWPFLWDHPGEPVPEENFWTLWCKGRLTEADTITTGLGATPSPHMLAIICYIIVNA